MREHVAQSFWQQHYGAHVSQLDTWFFTTYMCLIAVMKKAVVPKRLVEQLIMTAAIACCMAPLLLKHFRSLRAAMVYTMASEHAVHWRASHVTGGQNSDTPLMLFLVSMLGTSGGLIRNFEVLGLQQRSRLHLLVTLYFVAVQLWSSLPGFRLAHAYNFFYTVHEVYDAASALMSALVEGLVPLPATGQAVCSACPGIIAYVTQLNAWCPNRPVVPFAPWAFFNACQRGAELLRQWNIN
ncbi:hypothetical protein OEZ85_009992 [Tetradesmus obliquus]|uniref:Uncharacterized protein n=1 Tax=Tetradesmus obliquus TaxID=3088 RepID=A0ABY8UAQ9_TETOB|nr:hypothetical protein OEZ85_009992 [Tetradesmus obliquus]